MISVVWILTLVALLLLLGEEFPLILAVFGLVAPLFADNLGNIRVGEPRVLLHHLSLVMLAVKNEG